MEYFTRVLFGIANSLLIPDIVMLILLFFRALWLLFTTYGNLMTRRKERQLFGNLIATLTPSGVDTLRQQLPEKPGSLFARYLSLLLSHQPDEAYADYLITQYETEAAKETTLSRLLAKLGPVLGLIGTLISMSPALVGLSNGDIAGMAYNMQVVFSATVVGLLISAVGLFTLQLKQRWFAIDANQLDYVARMINRKEAES